VLPSTLTPVQKWLFLDWLQDTRVAIPIGYVFIYYYGLERRLLTDSYDLAFDEICHLRRYHLNPSFQGYSGSALLHASLLQRKPENIERIYVPSLWHAPDFEILHAFLTKKWLTPKELIALAEYIAGTNRYYSRNKPDLLNRELATILTKRYEQPALPLWREYDIKEFAIKSYPVFANVSLPMQIRSRPIPDILWHQRFVDDMRCLFNDAHEAVSRSLHPQRQASQSVQNATKLLSGIRSYAVQALAKLRDARALGALCEALNDGFVRQKAAQALGEIGDTRAVVPLLNVFRQNDLLAQQYAYEAIVRIGKPAIGPLREAISALEPPVRQYAQSLLRVRPKSPV
jgi:hypothetical protein